MKRHPDPGPGQSIGIDQDKTACMDAETFFFLSLLPSLPLSLRLPLCSSSSSDDRRLQPSCVSLVTFSPPKRIAECKAARSLKARGHVADAAQLGTHVRKLQGRENGPIWLAVAFSKTLHACECVHASACVRARTGSEAPVTETRA